MPKRVDNNQPEIVEALRAAGCTIQSLASVGAGCPDILAGRAGQTYLLEIKSSPSARLTCFERLWHANWTGRPVAVVSSIEEALHAVGLL